MAGGLVTDQPIMRSILVPCPTCGHDVPGLRWKDITYIAVQHECPSCGQIFEAQRFAPARAPYTGPPPKMPPLPPGAKDGYGGGVTCPSCGHEFRAYWVDTKTGPQQCPECGHEFEATWRGFTFEPETVVIRRIRPGRGARRS
jgi:uncharacterized Zn finger protein